MSRLEEVINAAPRDDNDPAMSILIELARLVERHASATERMAESLESIACSASWARK